jgi:hypothetical protein
MDELLVPDHSRLEVEIAFAKLTKYNSPGNDEIVAELFQEVIRKNCLISGRGLLLFQFTKRVTKLTVIIIVGYHCCQTPSVV